MNKSIIKLAFISCLLIASHAQATNGVLEINQTCAVQLGCFDGDDPGFPVTIDNLIGLSRSFRLTSDLVTADTSHAVIDIQTSNVSIDLNGFSITSLLCTTTDNDCTPETPAPNSGIKGLSSSNNISIKNGTIIGMADFGIALSGNNIKVESITAKWNNSVGVSVGNHSIINHCTIFGNGHRGIQSTNYAIVLNNVISENGNDGIYSQAGSSISNNITVNNDGDGISASTGSFISKNVARNNGDWGLRLTSTTAYTNNTITNNTSGTVFSGIQTGINVCDVNTSCP